MSQLPVSFFNLVAKASVQPDTPVSSGSDTDQAGFEASSFLQTVQALLEGSEADFQTLLSWNFNLPIVALAEMQPRENGNLLPDSCGVMGKGLPPALDVTASLSSAMVKSVEPAAFRSGMILGDATGGNGPALPFGKLFNSDLTVGLLASSDATGEAVSHIHNIPSGLQSTLSPVPLKASSPLLPVDVPVGQAGWDKAMGEKIQWMIGRNIQTAEVKLTPPNLGPLEIRVSVQQDQTSVNFIATQAPTREALEAALPRLREMLGEANLTLVDVDVGQRGDADSSRQWETQRSKTSYPAGHEIRDENQHLMRRSSNGVVDDYV